MTVTDLRLQYKREFGYYPDEDSDVLNSPLNWFERDDLEKYIKWLEEELIFIRNNFRISNRVLDMTKKSKI